MSELLINFHLPFLIFSIFVGFQISGYYLYLYFKTKKKHKGLNKLLLAYGLVYGIVMFSVLLRTIHTYLIVDLQTKNILFRLSHLTVAIASVLFLYIISADEFSPLFNVNITKLILFIAIIFNFLIFLIQDAYAQAFLIIIAVCLGAVFLTIFHWRLLKLYAGRLKRRLIIIFFGNAGVGLGILLEADEFIQFFSPQEQIILTLLATPIFIGGLLVMFLGLFQFPAFLEFDWRQDLQWIVILDKQSSDILYRFNISEYLLDKKNYSSLLSHNTQEDLISRGILGIESVILSVTKEKDLELIKQEDFVIFLNHGEPPFSNIIYCVVSDKEINSAHYFLATVKNEFQEIYRGLLRNLESIKEQKDRIFVGFDKKIKDILR